MQTTIIRNASQSARNIGLGILIASIGTVSFSSTAMAQVSGEWKLGTYTWQAKQSGSYISGRYNSDEGRVIGTLRGQTLTGHWIEKNSNQKCKYPRDGSYYWGGIILNYNLSFSTFEGSWGYCDTIGYRKWSGHRMGGGSSHHDEFNPIQGGSNAFVSTGFGGRWRVGNYIWDAVQSGNRLSGSYDSDDGRIIGSLSGNIFNGYWVEKSSGKKCSRQVDGSYFWGRTRWTYDSVKKTFSGSWGYCENHSYNNWSGRRLDNGAITEPVNGEGFRISRINPHFTVYNFATQPAPATVRFNWIAPLPSTIRIVRTDYQRKETVYEGPPISTLTLEAGRYSVWTRSQYGRDDGAYQAVVIAPDNVRK